MTLNYENAKTSIFIEDQLPDFVRLEGQPFIDFIKTYYDWLERKIVLIKLKSEYPIQDEDIQLNEILGSSEYYFVSEEGEIYVSETENTEIIFENSFSLMFDGTNGYTDYNGVVVDTSNDFTVTLFLQVNELPSIQRSDYDIITLSNTTYFSLLKIFESSNALGYNVNDEDVSTDLVIRKKEWYMISIRYNSTTNALVYNVFSLTNNYTYSFTEVLTTSNRFVFGCDLYNSRNFSDIMIDEVTVFDRYLSDTEVVELYNDGTAVDPSVYSDLTHFYRFEEANNLVIIDQISANNCTIYGDATDYIFETPFNLQAYITETEEDYNLLVNVLSYIRYDGGEEGTMSDRMLIFAEHVYGKLQKDIALKTTPTSSILISDFVEAKNPLNVINNLSNFQEIDYVFNYNNFISNIYFKFLWQETMHSFPLFIHSVHEESIKDIIAKNILDLYRSKGTFKAIKLLYKIIYNEDLSIGDDIYNNDAFEYTLKTRKYSDSEAISYLRNLVHPVGYKVNLEPPD